jgi:predicted HicB family RNase H-like nuclease
MKRYAQPTEHGAVQHARQRRKILTGVETARGNPLVQLIVRVPARLHRSARLHAVTQSMFLQQLVVEALEEALEGHRFDLHEDR